MAGHEMLLLRIWQETQAGRSVVVGRLPSPGHDDGDDVRRQDPQTLRSDVLRRLDEASEDAVGLALTP